MRRIYADYAATTPVRKEAIRAMSPYFDKHFGNPSSLHADGRIAADAIKNSRKIIADIINASPEEIIFTSGGTESDNLAIRGIASSNQKNGNHIITSAVEHHAVLNTVKDLEKEGFDVTIIPVNKYGEVDPKEIERAITKKTILISVMHANNEIGTIQPIGEIGKTAKKHSVPFHVDAVQTFCHLPIDVKRMNIDLLSVSSHKIGGPKGVGALYVRKGLEIKPLFTGGPHEFNKRAGTENVAGIVGFAKAAEIANKEMEREKRRLEKLRDRIIDSILSSVPGSRLNGHPKNRLANNVNFGFVGVEGEALLLMLDSMGISASTGSACSSHNLSPSHVLLALDPDPVKAHGSLRITLGYKTTEKEVDYIIKAIQISVKKIREITPKIEGVTTY
ncbi:MAG: cysteine desulfurase [Candidatus Micrarchaeota archaeon]|nr:cysteine desulfurase [Candidatus Micrarchaeota archaeon]